MNFDDLQKAWKTQDAGPRVTIDADLLLKEVRRNQRHFWMTLFWRDVREVGVAFLLALFFLHQGIRCQNWTFCLLALACFGVGAFMVADRLHQRRTQPAPEDSLKACIEISLHQVNHQIWLLRNVFWWYLLPIAAPLGISVFASLWHARRLGYSALIGGGLYALIVVLLYWGIYWFNQFAVRKTLDPRRQELEALLAGFDENSH